MDAPHRILPDVVTNTGTGMQPERVSAAFADERIAEKIGQFAQARQREGMEALNKTLLEHEVPPGVRLHLITAVSHLGRLAEGSLEDRRSRVRPE